MNKKRSIKSVYMWISDHMVHHKNIYTSLISNAKTNLVNLSKVSSSWLQKFSQPVGQSELKIEFALEKSKEVIMKYPLSSAYSTFNACDIWCCFEEFVLVKRPSVVMGASYMQEAWI